MHHLVLLLGHHGVELDLAGVAEDRLCDGADELDLESVELAGLGIPLAEVGVFSSMPATSSPSS